MRTVAKLAFFLHIVANVAIARSPVSPEARTEAAQRQNAASTLSVVHVKAVQPTVPGARPRRCEYLGRFGSFTLIDAGGTAAYRLSNRAFVADLELAGQDANWWIYRPTGNGDPSTIKWAFSRRPYRGCYIVLRFAHGIWWQYELTQAWGIGLGDSDILFQRTVEVETSELLQEVRRILDKLSIIQPNNSPSLQDLEALIRARQGQN